jgi:CheY-like chemotaxis protein
MTEANRNPVLLVDDFDVNIKTFGALLEELGYAYDVARSGFESIEKLSAASYDVVIMDVQMPGIDGLETARRIRVLEKQENRRSVTIIGMSGNSTEDDRFFCKKAGMDDFLPKPFRLKELEEKLQRYVRL